MKVQLMFTVAALMSGAAFAQDEAPAEDAPNTKPCPYCMSTIAIERPRWRSESRSVRTRHAHQRAIPARHNIGDDRAHRIFHIGRGLPLGGEKRAEARFEISRAVIKADRHACTIARIERSEIRES